MHAAARPKTRTVGRRLGGRATATGVAYESSIAASIAATMLCGSKATLWESLGGDDIVAVSVQAPEAVDDVVVTLRQENAKAFVSAKYRGSGIPVTSKSPAFTEPIAAFVAQMKSLPEHARRTSIFIWAIPSSAGAAAAIHLPAVLDAHRAEAEDVAIAEFVAGRPPNQKRVFDALMMVAAGEWAKQNGIQPSESELREFLRLVHVELYDFQCGQRHDRSARQELATHVVSTASEAAKAWRVIERVFARNNKDGLTATAQSLRAELSDAEIELALPPDYADDIEQLRRLTTRNVMLLGEHTLLPFGAAGTSRVHIDRTDELTRLVAAAQANDLLLTGEPGCGKSGIIHDSAIRFQNDGKRVVVLLAEEMASALTTKGDLLDLSHPLVDVLCNWPTPNGGVLLTDALDSVREPTAQREIRALLRTVRDAEHEWRVIASVREFDLKHSRELREVFPGAGVAGYESSEFVAVSHFHLRGLTEDQLDELGQRRPEIVAFLDSARANPKSVSLHKSPFYLRLAAELLSTGVASARVADWNSPSLLLRKFWEHRIGGGGAEPRVATIGAICRAMVKERTMVLAAQEVPFDASGLTAANELRSRGILQGPSLLHGDQVGAETVRFSHHLLHDYAIARVYIPAVPNRFTPFVLKEPLLPIFYRQSFVFALEEIWDVDQSRESFWRTVLELEGVASLHGLSRILGPMVAARRVEQFSDLLPLLQAVSHSVNNDDPAHKAMRHLASGLQDAPPELILAGAAAWCQFAEQLSGSLSSSPFLEAPLTHILARLDSIGAY